MITTVGVFKTHQAAETAINELRAFGVSPSDMSYVYVTASGEIVDAHTENKIGTGLTSGATTGTVIGAIAGLAIANGILPGLGSLIVAGPLAVALGFTGVAATTVAAAATGAAAGGFIGALSHMGVSQTDAVFYETLVRSGEVLVVANTASLVTKNLLMESGAQEVREYIR